MKQVSLKMKSYARSINIIDDGCLQRYILHAMLWMLAFLVVFYIFSVGKMVFDIVERRSLEKEIIFLRSEVGSLEQEYFSLSQKIDLNFAQTLGFKETRSKFVTHRNMGALGSIELVKNEI